jgi:hypothetical protein
MIGRKAQSLGFDSWVNLSEFVPSIPRKNHYFDAYFKLFNRLGGLVTDRFHGSIIGMHFVNGPVVGVEKSRVYPERNGKLRDLFVRLERSSCLIEYDRITGISHDKLEYAFKSAVLDILPLQRIAGLRGVGLASLREIVSRLGCC